jgi:hypothetical protein
VNKWIIIIKILGWESGRKQVYRQKIIKILKNNFKQLIKHTVNDSKRKVSGGI